MLSSHGRGKGRGGAKGAVTLRHRNKEGTKFLLPTFFFDNFFLMKICTFYIQSYCIISYLKLLKKVVFKVPKHFLFYQSIIKKGPLKQELKKKHFLKIFP